MKTSVIAALMACCIIACNTPAPAPRPTVSPALPGTRAGPLVIAYQANETGAVEPCG